MKNFFVSLSIPKISGLMLISCSLFMTFFISPSYKSQSILDISSEDESMSTNTLFDSIVTPGPQDAYQLKAFLSSNEASSIFEKNTDINKIYANEDITFFSRFRKNKRNSFHDFYLKKIFLSIDADSNALIIDTFAFSPEDAQFINLQLINMSADFFNRKARMQSFNIKTSKICELYSINSDILNLDMTDFDSDSELVSKSDSANELLLSKSMRYKDLCLERLDESSEDDQATSEIFPFFELKNINADASKQVLLEIYDKSLDSVTSSNNLKIIAEPITPTTAENKNIILYSILVFVITFITLLSMKILLRLNEEFET